MFIIIVIIIFLGGGAIKTISIQAQCVSAEVAC